MNIEVEPLLAISTKPPWAWWCASGIKTLETRERNTAHRGEIAIHASQQADGDWKKKAKGLSCDAYERTLEDWRHAEYFGAIVAVADLVDVVLCTEKHTQAALCHCAGRYGYVLENVRRLDIPVPCRGHITVPWRAPEHVAVEVRFALGQPYDSSVIERDPDHDEATFVHCDDCWGYCEYACNDPSGFELATRIRHFEAERAAAEAERQGVAS